MAAIGIFAVFFMGFLFGFFTGRVDFGEPNAEDTPDFIDIQPWM